MDDLFCIHTINSNSNQQRIRSQEQIQSLIYHCYDSALELELTSSQDGADKHLQYLDYDIRITNDFPHPTILLSPLMKNSQSIHDEQKQMFVHFQHWHSYSPALVKFGVIKSCVLRYFRNSNSDCAFINSMINLQDELFTLQYPSYVLINTIKSCFYTYQLPLYQIAYQIIQAINRYKKTKIQMEYKKLHRQ
jgi:hypothetical protein